MYRSAISARNAIVPSHDNLRHLRHPVANNKFKKLSIIIPCYNEASTIAIVLDKVNEVALTQNIEKEILIVNDCSVDDTELVIMEYIQENPAIAIRYIRHTVNQGKGAAVHTGIHEATGDYIIIQDADLEYDPAEYNTMLIPILKGHADVVYGSRFMGGNAHRILFFWHSIGNRFLTFLSNVLSNQNLTDMETGYKIFKADLLKSLNLKEKRFGFEPEVTSKIAAISDIRIYEIGISYYGRTYKEGKKIKWMDGVRTVYCILKYSFLRSVPASKQAPIPAQL